MTYYLKALQLIAQGGRYGRHGLAVTLALVMLRQCRLQWLRQGEESSTIKRKGSFGTLKGAR